MIILTQTSKDCWGEATHVTIAPKTEEEAAEIIQQLLSEHPKIFVVRNLHQKAFSWVEKEVVKINGIIIYDK